MLYPIEHLDAEYVRIANCSDVRAFCILEAEGYEILHITQVAESWEGFEPYAMARVRRRIVRMVQLPLWDLKAA
jgi:hypothetical protein